MKKTNKTAKVNGAAVVCGCGCGDAPRGKRSRFIPGHDAKLVSAALKVERGEVKLAQLPKGVAIAVRAFRKAA